MSNQKSTINELPYAISITLYKHNYYDRLIVSHLKRNYKIIEVANSDDNFIVECDDMFKLLYSEFRNEINRIETLSEIEVGKNANCIYFINKLLKSFVNLKYIKVILSDTENYTRMVETEHQKYVINFEYKILTCIIDFGDYLINKEEFQAINMILKSTGLIIEDVFSPGKSYINTTSQDLISMLNLYEQINFDETGLPKGELQNPENIDMVLNVLYSLINNKIQADNSRLILITDYLN